MNLLDKVKERLEITGTNYDTKIQSYIDEITNKIKSVCNRIDLPQELEYLVVRYAVNCYIFYKDNASSNTLQQTSVTDGNQTVKFEIVQNITKSDVDADRVISKNIDEISQYAYMRW